MRLKSSKIEKKKLLKDCDPTYPTSVAMLR